MEIETIKEKVKQFILDEFLPGENPEALNDSTNLINDGILDSIASLKLVSFIEKQFSVKVEAHEVNVDHLNRLPQIADLVVSKLD